MAVIAPGVIDNGDGTYKQNDIPVNPETYWKAIANDVQSAFVYDNSYVKCREITFGYNFPEKMLSKLKIVKSLSLSFVARNPFIIWKRIPISILTLVTTPPVSVLSMVHCPHAAAMVSMLTSNSNRTYVL